MGLQRCIDMLFGHSENHHFVVGQQVLLDRPREGEAMKLRSIYLRVVH